MGRAAIVLDGPRAVGACVRVGRRERRLAVAAGDIEDVLGLAQARDVAAQGAHVIMADVLADTLEQSAAAVRAAHPVQVRSFVGDLAREEVVGALLALAREQFGGATILVNNAGGGVIRPFLEHTPETLRAMEPRIATTTDVILPGNPLDVVAYGCTSASMAIGEEKVFARIREARPNAKCTTPITAAFAAFRALKARRIGVLTPYRADVNRIVADYIRARGFEVPVFGSFNEQDDRVVARITPASASSSSTGVPGSGVGPSIATGSRRFLTSARYRMRAVSSWPI